MNPESKDNPHNIGNDTDSDSDNDDPHTIKNG